MACRHITVTYPPELLPTADGPASVLAMFGDQLHVWTPEKGWQLAKNRIQKQR